jgi:hypothetical protein
LKLTQRFLCCSFLLAGSAALISAAQTPAAPQTPAPPAAPAAQPAEELPVLDGAAGPCSLQLTVTTPDGKPVYAAKVKVHIEHRFGGFHKLDLEASTNSSGQLKFIGLPSRVKRPPLEFRASKDDLIGLATYDPSADCHAKHTITLSKPTPTP